MYKTKLQDYILGNDLNERDQTIAIKNLSSNPKNVQLFKNKFFYPANYQIFLCDSPSSKILVFLTY
jgi:hypothetical protein